MSFKILKILSFRKEGQIFDFCDVFNEWPNISIFMIKRHILLNKSPCFHALKICKLRKYFRSCENYANAPLKLFIPNTFFSNANGFLENRKASFNRY